MHFLVKICQILAFIYQYLAPGPKYLAQKRSSKSPGFWKLLAEKKIDSNRRWLICKLVDFGAFLRSVRGDPYFSQKSAKSDLLRLQKQHFWNFEEREYEAKETQYFYENWKGIISSMHILVWYEIFWWINFKELTNKCPPTFGIMKNRFIKILKILWYIKWEKLAII